VGCNWVKELVLQLGRVLWFFVELGFNSLTSFGLVLGVYLFKFFVFVAFFLDNKIKKLVCITFVHIHHFVKIENWNNHNQNFFEKSKIICNQMVKSDGAVDFRFFQNIYPSFFKNENILYWYLQDKPKM